MGMRCNVSDIATMQRINCIRPRVRMRCNMLPPNWVFLAVYPSLRGDEMQLYDILHDITDLMVSVPAWG